MSFSSELKRELCGLDSELCCSYAETYAMFMYGHKFDSTGITLQTESGAVAQAAAERLAIHTNAFVEVRTPLTQRGTVRIHTVTVDETQRNEVLQAFGHSRKDVGRKINFANLQNPCCAVAFIRGAFLACGTVNDPEKGYHLEFNAPNRALADGLELLFEQAEMHPGRTERKGAQVIYFKNSEDILALLTLLGAEKSAEQMRQVRAVKERRNAANRRTNFDTANIDKTVSASAEQIEAILKIKNSAQWGQLPENLRELAELRLAHPEYSLRELGEALSVPVSRSGVNHRLTKLAALAAALPVEEAVPEEAAAAK